MTSKDNFTFDILKNSIESTIYEGGLKLGSLQGNVSIYYDLDLINHLLNASFSNNEICLRAIQKLFLEAGIEETDLSVSLENGRFKFTADSNGLKRIEKVYKDKRFLYDLIELTRSRNFDLEQIKSLFQKYSNAYICRKIEHPEFQYVFSFPDKKIDQYNYCFTFDEMGGYYHRLLDYDFGRLLEEHNH